MISIAKQIIIQFRTIPVCTTRSIMRTTRYHSYIVAVTLPKLTDAVNL